MSKRKIVFVCLMLSVGTKVYGDESETGSEVYLAPYQATQGLQLDGSDLSKNAVRILSEKLDRPDIRVRVEQKSGLHVADTASETVTLSFEKNGIPLCFMQVKATATTNSLALFGNIPKIDQSPNTELHTPDPRESLETAWNALRMEIPIVKEKFIHKQECLYLSEGSLISVWEMTLQTSGLNYKVWADETRIYKLSKLYFDVTAKIQSYDRDSVTNKDTKIFEQDVKSDTLTNDLFVTDPSTDESEIQRAKSTDNSFIFSPSDPLFNEASLFAHANEHYSFFNKLGYRWSGRSLVVKFHVLVGDTENNAYYQPGDDPLIMIGDGDGVILRNLASDADVVSHEFGHHVIFKNVQDTSGESLILHEGLADYFVFAKTGDPCLGRSICVPGATGACAISGQCLRVASKTLKFKSEEYENSNPHFKGQLVSGFLYGLNDIIDPKIVPQLVYNAVQMLVNNSGLRHLVLATMLADYKMNKGVNACKIYDAAVNRGLSSLLHDTQCNKMDSVTLVSTPPPSGVIKTTTRKKKHSFLGCSGLAKVPSEQFDATVFFFLVPVVLRRRFIS